MPHNVLLDAEFIISIHSIKYNSAMRIRGGYSYWLSCHCYLLFA